MISKIEKISLGLHNWDGTEAEAAEYQNLVEEQITKTYGEIEIEWHVQLDASGSTPYDLKTRVTLVEDYPSAINDAEYDPYGYVETIDGIKQEVFESGNWFEEN